MELIYTLTSVEHSFDDRWSSSSIGSSNSPGCYKQAITNSWWLTANSVSKFQRIHQRIHNFLQHNFSAGGYIQQKSFTNILKKKDQFEPLLERERDTHTPDIQQHLYASPPRLYQILDAIPSHRLLSSNDLTWALFHSCFFFKILTPRNEHKTITNGHDCNDVQNSTLFISTIENKNLSLLLGIWKAAGEQEFQGRVLRLRNKPSNVHWIPPNAYIGTY